MAFNQTPRVLQTPTRDRAAVSAALARMASAGGTATGDAIATRRACSTARPASAASARPRRSCCSPTARPRAAATRWPRRRRPRKLHIPVYTVALGTRQGTITKLPQQPGRRVHRDPRAARPALARADRPASGGQTFTAETARGLSAVYEQLGSQLGTKNEKRQITSGFAGGGLLLLLGGAAMSLAWFGRLV